MVKKNKKKKEFFRYSQENLKNAVEAVQSGRMSKHEASREFGVPRTTLLRKASGKVSLERKMGPDTELTTEEEMVFVDWLLARAKKGFPVDRHTLLLSVGYYLKQNNREVRFLNKTTLKPGRSWFQQFLKRHPNLKERYAEGVSKARAAVTKDSIENWFDEILIFLRENGLEFILNDPSRIFNADEAGFNLCPTSLKVVGPAKLEDDFYERLSNEKEQITVLAAFSAVGKYAPPLIIYPYKKVPRAIVESVPENWALGHSDSGWINSEVFFEYISNHLIKYLKDNNIKRPVLLFVDGHKSHLTQQVSKLCDDNGIILIALFPNTTHITQPADVAVFRPLKAGWQSAIREWKYHNFPKDVTRFTFGSIIKQVFQDYAKPTTIQNGFRKCGLYPFDKTNVDYSKCIPNRQTKSTFRAAGVSNFYQKILDTVESKIESDVLENFQTCFEEKKPWDGNIEYTALYKVWNLLKDENESKKIRFPVTAENELTVPLNEENTDFIGTNVANEVSSNTLEDTKEKDMDKKKDSIDFAKETDDNENVPNTLKEIQSSPIPSSSKTEWKTPENANSYTYEEREKQGFKVPTPFKKFLPFPKTPEKKPLKRKRTVFPAVISSAAYREYYKEEQRKKETTPKNKKKKTIVSEQEKAPPNENKTTTSNDKEPTSEANTQKILIDDEKKTQSGRQRKTQPKKSKITLDEESTSESDTLISLDDDDDSDDFHDLETLMVIKEGTYVVVKYDENYYPGVVLKKDGEGADVSTMVAAGIGAWKWPNPPDVVYYFNEDILAKIKAPVSKNNRGHYTVAEMSKYI